jgi:hypothetical protein
MGLTMTRDRKLNFRYVVEFLKSLFPMTYFKPPYLHRKIKSVGPKNLVRCLKKLMVFETTDQIFCDYRFFCCLNRFGPLSQKKHGFWDNGSNFLRQQIFRSSQQIKLFGEPFSVGWSANQILDTKFIKKLLRLRLEGLNDFVILKSNVKKNSTF